MIDTELDLEQEGTDTIENPTDTIEQEGAQQQTQEPTPEPKGPSRDDLMQSALNEGVEEAVLSELADKEGELSLADLRKIPGTDDLSDEELTKEWNRAVAIAQGQQRAETKQTPEAKPFELPWPVYDEKGNKVDASALTLKDALERNLQFGYNALGKEQRKLLTDVFRNASQGHWNEQKYTSTVQERNQAVSELGKLRDQVKTFEQERATWDAALTALNMGNAEPMRKLAQAYQQALTNAPMAKSATDVARQEQETFMRGLDYLQNQVIPAGVEIATRYGANPQEVLGAIRYYLEQEPAEFLTADKINAILQYEIPALLERNGYTAGAPNANGGANGQGSKPGTENTELAELKKIVTNLQSQLAGTKNASTARTRERQRNTPPAGSGVTGTAGDSMPSFKSRAQFKAWSQGDPDWSKY